MRTIEAKISLGRMYYPVKSLGPGNRVGIWLNGCNRRCVGCISPELQMYDASKEVTVNELMKMIQRIEAPIDGFTISGGEPFFNPLSLNALVQSLAGICDDILIFTGYTIEELRAQESEAVDSVLNTCAALIDGQYIQELNDNKGLRGSSNQRCLIFKYHDRYQEIETSDRTLQNIMYGNKVLTIGISRRDAFMINAAETQPPKSQIGQIINAGETIPPGSASQSGQSIVLLAGESVADSYVINSLMNKQGKQSNVYLAKKWGKSYVVKIYHNGWRPSNQMQSFLTSVRHPNIAHVVECGEHGGYYYEIYEYYSEGTLEDVGALSSAHIQNTLVPSINEGLHELHRNGIVHCDIKPSNLFYTDNGERVVIGDCGISGYTNSNGKLVDAVRGTPEYAPRVKALLWSAAMSPAYDYGSFGLVLCKAVLGHSIFEGMSVEEISKAWEGGLDLPSQISGRLGVLIKGLLNEDEEQRWGYVQVKRWCEGEYMRPVNRSIYSRTKKENQNKPLIFGRFEGQTVSVTTLHQLAQAIKSHWAQASRIVKRRELIDFVRQFDKSLVEKIRELALYQDSDAAVYKLLMYIEDDPQQIFYCGKEYGSLSEYVDQLSTGKDEMAKKFLSTGLLVFYLRYNDYEQAQVDRLEQLIRRNGSNDMASISTICFALQGKKAIDIFGVSVETMDALIPVLSKCSIKEINELLQSDRFIAWLNRLGYEKEMRRMKEAFV